MRYDTPKQVAQDVFSITKRCSLGYRRGKRLFATRRGNADVSTISAHFFMPGLRCGVCSCKFLTRCPARPDRSGSDRFCLLVWWWFENSRACFVLLFDDCQSGPARVRVSVVRVPGRGLMGLGFGRILCGAMVSGRWAGGRGVRLFSSSFFFRAVFRLFTGFFVEGSILAQDERWRRA